MEETHPCKGDKGRKQVAGHVRVTPGTTAPEACGHGCADEPKGGQDDEVVPLGDEPV
ncbi:uncharacterized protein PHACADRAFT_266582 [Phanerochaete carnosa HHB-10118-sp]|uniref:Uncharacterized protein n=1 Tax=Phanerochaete carnosa (strain HHB-10118-sp) TaxID=650164 RepID=K5VN60_PHACS|nr:uncharacterized protein PHACADRAFT_265888 [Phanerochaete carnosa HHB-10118-sp]XP_007402460.1 uncharacterized protein PHACADRAFT_265924 [Phanerochaete carnosa HHB-10118-sp]XP_007403415.1 uncharacterized protein PHACADRAFT_266582 [Phanerochaete carnosa HHB-10118-sp]EKM48034.1 hypothetical protein PHACADRAFT_266582 [Phanerochaete carnosa HHB-10118-sp]EKM48987.1 hypothetical protein PHACADRAFT_265924 [Phanerochaete carnosa HHB-10118-sp]EKM49039.1 hypothetical protein PHACADRAFT_265888 [Phaneroc